MCGTHARVVRASAPMPSETFFSDGIALCINNVAWFSNFDGRYALFRSKPRAWLRHTPYRWFNEGRLKAIFQTAFCFPSNFAMIQKFKIITSKCSLHNPHHRVRGCATHPTADSTLADFRRRVCALRHARFVWHKQPYFKAVWNRYISGGLLLSHCLCYDGVNRNNNKGNKCRTITVTTSKAARFSLPLNLPTRNRVY